MPASRLQKTFLKPLVALAIPGMYLVYKYNQLKRSHQENSKRKVTEKELLSLNHKIDKLLAKLDEHESDAKFSDEDECVVCLSAKATMQTFPCGHRVVCRKCFVKTIQVAVAQRCLPLKCVVCRTRVLKLKQAGEEAVSPPTARRGGGLGGASSSSSSPRPSSGSRLFAKLFSSSSSSSSKNSQQQQASSSSQSSSSMSPSPATLASSNTVTAASGGSSSASPYLGSGRQHSGVSAAHHATPSHHGLLSSSQSQWRHASAAASPPQPVVATKLMQPWLIYPSQDSPKQQRAFLSDVYADSPSRTTKDSKHTLFRSEGPFSPAHRRPKHHCSPSASSRIAELKHAHMLSPRVPRCSQCVESQQRGTTRKGTVAK